MMAYWGQAFSLLGNPFSPPSPKNLGAGPGRPRAGEAIGAKSQREADYVAALLTFYRDHDQVDHRTRVVAYEQAMADLAARYPDDPEARIYHALALNVAHSPADKSYAKPLQAAAILEAEWERQPDHPGVAHYLIHTYDYPPLAQQGLPAAERYATIAPDAPHARHMPSHIFTRVGAWEELIQIEPGRRRERPQGRPARRRAARARLHGLRPPADGPGGRGAAHRGASAGGPGRCRGQAPLARAAVFALNAIPARLVMEQAAWDQADALTPRTSTFPFAEAQTHYARAVAFARSGRPDQAETDLARLDAIVQALAGKDPYWAEQIDIQRATALAWVAFANGEQDAALAAMRAAADREGKTEKHAVTPGPLAPAREQLAEMLVQAGRPGEAVTEFEAVQLTEPNRFRAIYGAAHSAELAGDRARAGEQYARLLELAGKADTERAELTEARAFLAAN